MNIENIKRFEKYIGKSFDKDACWIWLGSVKRGGYGAFRLEGTTRRAHRVSYELYRGKIPDGLHVLHSCDNPECVNPDHLFLGTNADNVHDKIVKGRQAFNRGEKHGNVKLTDEQVQEIRDLCKSELYTQAEIARMYGVSQVHIHGIHIGKERR